MNIYVGNLSFRSEENDVQSLFEQHGAVKSVTIIKDNFTGRSKGFGFVVMDDQNEANTAIQQLNGTSLNGNTLTVNEARPRTNDNNNRDRRSGGNNYSGGGGKRW